MAPSVAALGVEGLRPGEPAALKPEMRCEREGNRERSDTFDDVEVTVDRPAQQDGQKQHQILCPGDEV